MQSVQGIKPQQIYLNPKPWYSQDISDYFRNEAMKSDKPKKENDQMMNLYRVTIYDPVSGTSEAIHTVAKNERTAEVAALVEATKAGGIYDDRNSDDLDVDVESVMQVRTKKQIEEGK
jgi:hypothetical protein